MQVAIEGNDECELGESENDSLETMTEDSTAETHSTKRPLKSQSDKHTKKQRKESQEEELMKKAISCIENAFTNDTETRKDEYHLFGQYIAAELRTVEAISSENVFK